MRQVKLRLLGICRWIDEFRHMAEGLIFPHELKTYWVLNSGFLSKCLSVEWNLFNATSNDWPKSETLSLKGRLTTNRPDWSRSVVLMKCSSHSISSAVLKDLGWYSSSFQNFSICSWIEGVETSMDKLQTECSPLGSDKGPETIHPNFVFCKMVELFRKVICPMQRRLQNTDAPILPSKVKKAVSA